MRPTADPIAEAYSGKRVLITGASGFLGGVTLSMLLDRSWELDRVFVLIRRSPGLPAQTRFIERVLASRAFDPMRERWDAIAPKVTIVQGDLSEPALGLDPAERSEIGRLDLIFNCAGLVDFCAPLDQALRVNIEGTRHVGQFALEVGAALVHVSTCFVAGRCGAEGPLSVPETAERGYFPRRFSAPFLAFSPEQEIADLQGEISRLEQEMADQSALARFTDLARQRALDAAGGLPGPAVLANAARRLQRDETTARLVEAGQRRADFWGWPNVYTYSKSIGEQVLLGLAEERGLSVSLVRPAIIESALSYPEPGFNQNATTSAPLIGLALAGYRPTPADPDLVLDIVPVDAVAGSLLLVGAAALQGRAERVYQIGTSSSNPCKMERIADLIGLYVHEKRLDEDGSPLGRLWAANREPSLLPRRVFEGQVQFASKALPSAIEALRQGARLTATPRLRDALERLASRLETTSREAARAADLWDLFLPFSCDLDYRFASGRLEELWQRFGQTPFWRDLDWQSYWLDVHIPGLRRHVLADSDGRPGPKIVAPRASLVERIQEVAESDGYRAALTWCLGDRPTTWTYRELWDRAQEAPGQEPSLLVAGLVGLRAGQSLPAGLGLAQTGRALTDRLAAIAERLGLRERRPVVVSSEDPRALQAALATWFAKGEVWLVAPDLLDEALESSAAEVAAVGTRTPKERHRLRAVLDVAPEAGHRRLAALRSAKVAIVGPEGEGPPVESPEGARPLLSLAVSLREGEGVAEARTVDRTAIVRPDLEAFADLRGMVERMRRLLADVNADRPHAERLTAMWLTLAQGDPIDRESAIVLSARDDRPPMWDDLPDDRIPLDELEAEARQLARGLLTDDDLRFVWDCHRQHPRSYAQVRALERTLVRALRRIAASPDGRFHAQAFAQDYESEAGRIRRPEYRAAYRVGTWLSRWKTWFEDADPQSPLLPEAVTAPVRKALSEATRTFFDRAMDVTVRGQAYLPAQGSLIVVANHSSHLDAGAIKVALGPWGDRLRTLAARDYFFKTPARRFAARHFTRLIPVDRQAVSTQWIKEAREALASGDWVLLFPEGTRTASVELQAFKASVGTLVRACQADVLPVFVEGTGEILPKGSVLPKGRRIRVHLGPPIPWGTIALAAGEGGALAMDREIARFLERAVGALPGGDPFWLGGDLRGQEVGQPV